MKKNKGGKKEGSHFCIQCIERIPAFKQKNWRCRAYTHVNVLDGTASHIRCITARSAQSETPNRCVAFRWKNAVPDKPQPEKGVTNNA